MYGEKFKEATQSLMTHCRQRMGYDSDPDVHYVTDKNNANSMLGMTAHYQPDKRVVTIYISNRHPKDALRSLAHELVHHAQNLRGDLENTQTEEGYAQRDPHMRKMEEEAYLEGNMMFRDWEDTCKSNKTLNLNLPSRIGENKMSDQLNKLVAEKVLAQLNEQGIEIDEGLLDRLMAKGKGKLAGLGSRLKGAAAGFQGKGVEAGAPQAAEVEAMFKSRIPKAAKQINKIVADLAGDLDELGLAQDERIKNVLGRLKGVQTSFNKVAQELIPAVEDAVEDAPEDAPEQGEEHDEDGKPHSFRFDPGAWNPLREEEVDEIVKDEIDESEEEVEEGKGYGITTSPKNDQSLTGRPLQGKDAKKPKEKATGVDFGAIKTHKMDDKKPGKPKRVGKGDGKGNFSTVQDVNEEEVEEGFYRNPDARGQGGQDIDSGVGKSALGNMGAAHNKLRKDSRLLDKLQGQFIGDISLLKYGKKGEMIGRKGQSKRKIMNVIRKYEKKAAKAGIEFEVPNFEDVLAEKVENELADIKKGQDSIKNLNEQRNQKLNDELMRRLLK